MKAMDCEFSPSGTVLKYCLNKEIQSIVIPETVKKIEGSAFRECRNLKKVVFPVGLQKIGKEAFRECSSLQEIDLSSSALKEMADSAFCQCGSLVKVALPAKLQEIPYDTFRNCISLTEITLPDRLRHIGKNAFRDCKKLPFLNIPSSVEEIGKYAFCGCASLQSVHLPFGLEKIQEGVFKDCTLLADINLPQLDQLEVIEVFAFWNCRILNLILPENLADLQGGLYGIKSIDVSNCRSLFWGEDGILRNRRSGTILYAPETLSGDYRLDGSETNGSGTVRIAPYAFYHCSGLTSVNSGPANEIGDYAFAECQNLETARFEDVLLLGTGVFSGCENLREVSFGAADDEDGLLTCLPDQTFRDCRKLQKFVIPESIEKIGEKAFLRCRSLTEINIPYKLKELGVYAFCECFSLRQMILYCGLKWIPGSAFAFCENLRRVLLPDCLHVIHTKAFAGCSNLSKINLPEGLQEIGDEAFFRCLELDVRIPSTVKEIEGGALAMTKSFSLAPGNQLFACDESGALFKRIISFIHGQALALVAFPHSYLGEYMLPRGVEEIRDMAFFNCSGLCGTLELGGALAAVGNMAFSGCTSLTLYLSKSFRAGEDRYEPGRDRFWVSAFPGVRQIVIDEKVDYFYYDKQGALCSLNRRRVKYLPPDFTGKYIVVGKPETIYQGFFEGHSGVTEVVLPSSIQAIRAYAFANCENLQRVEIPEDAGPLEIEYKAFANCPELREVVLPCNVVSIDPEAFSGSPCEAEIKRRYGHLFTESSDFEISIIHYYQSWREARQAKMAHDAGSSAEDFPPEGESDDAR